MSTTWREIYRKIVHVALSLLLFAPFYFKLPPPLNPYSYYSLGLFLAAFINSVVVKKDKLTLEINALRDELHRFADSIGDIAKMPISILEEILTDFHSFVEKQLSLLERDYEKREGYVGLLYGIIGATSSLLVDPSHAFYGIVALAVVDVLASMSSLLIWNKGKTMGGEAIAFLSFAIILMSLGVPVLQSILVSAVATLSEYFSPEDNLTVPFFTTIAAFILKLPERHPL
ncbi:MAG: hypothetical protein ACPLRJ_04745 [Infirmifilum uzonense]|uniref:hypothetical protein n=1 Tax=Infirmifilum TaxID=2856573 RepID=UPI0023568BBC